MYRLFRCIPIFKGGAGGGGGGGVLKVRKGYVYMIMLKMELVLFKIHVLM